MNSVFHIQHSVPNNEEKMYMSDNPIPIYSEDSRLLGFASIQKQKSYRVVFSMGLDPATPERLDIEIGSKRYWVKVEFDRTEAFGIFVRKLILVTEEIKGQYPISPDSAILVIASL